MYTRTSRQIRQEALPIFYSRNEFGIMVPDCDNTLLKAFGFHLERLPYGMKAEEVVLLIGSEGRCDWENLSKWCKDVWLDRCDSMQKSGNEGGKTAVIEAAHAIVREQKFNSWEACEQALENLRYVAQRYDSDWN